MAASHDGCFDYVTHRTIIPSLRLSQKLQMKIVYLNEIRELNQVFELKQEATRRYLYFRFGWEFKYGVKYISRVFIFCNLLHERFGQ